MTSPIVSTQWLSDNLVNENLMLLDVSMNKVVGKEPLVYEQPVYIPTTRRLSLERDLIDLDSDQTNAFPTVEQFNRVMTDLGICTNSIVVVYDNQGIYSSPRAWWIFKTMGFANVFMLDGGLPQWIQEKRQTVSILEEEQKSGDVRGRYQESRLVDVPQVINAINSTQSIIIDARSAGRFRGIGKEPRAGLRSGHIPSSKNLPFAKVLDGYKFKSKEQLKDIYQGLLGTAEQSLIFSCGSGITACILIAAATITEQKSLSLYDGSWAQWGSDSSLPIEVG